MHMLSMGLSVLEDNSKSSFNNPIDLIGSDEPTVSHTTQFLAEPSDETHHLDCFTLRMLDDTHQPSTLNSDMSKTTASDMPFRSSQKKILQQPSSSGPPDALGSAVKECRETCVATKAIEELFSERASNKNTTNGSNSNKTNSRQCVDVSPTTVLSSRTMKGTHSKHPLRALLDSGSQSNFMCQAALPKATKQTGLATPLAMENLNTDARIDTRVKLEDIVFTEFSHTAHTDQFNCYVTSVTSKCDIIMGRMTMRQLGMQINFNADSIHWHKLLPMKPPLTQPWMTHFRQAQQQFLSSFEDDVDKLAPARNDASVMTSAKMSESKCDQADADKVAESIWQHHSTKNSKFCSANVPSFSVESWVVVHIARCIWTSIKRRWHQRHYPVRDVNRKVFYKEPKQLEALGVLTEIKDMVDFAAPTFLVPKKDGRVRWASDFRELNNGTRRKACPLPHINQMLRKHEKCSFFTKLDISMQCYAFELDEESKALCAISTPFGTF